MEIEERIIFGVFGENNQFEYSLYTNGTFEVKWKGKEGDKTTDMPDDYDLQFNPWPWHDYRSSIIAVDIDPEITSIGNYAFWNCYNLQIINFGESSQCTKVGIEAFSFCDSVKKLEIPVLLTSFDRISLQLMAGLEEILVKDGNNVYGSMDGVLYERLYDKTGELYEIQVVLYPPEKKDEYWYPKTASFGTKCCRNNYLRYISFLDTYSNFLGLDPPFTLRLESECLICENLEFIDFMGSIVSSGKRHLIDESCILVPIGHLNSSSYTKDDIEYITYHLDIYDYVYSDYGSRRFNEQFVNDFNEEYYECIKDTKKVISYQINYQLVNVGGPEQEPPNYAPDNIYFETTDIDGASLSKQSIGEDYFKYRIMAYYESQDEKFEITSKVQISWQYYDESGQPTKYQGTGNYVGKIPNTLDMQQGGGEIRLMLAENYKEYPTPEMVWTVITLVDRFKVIDVQLKNSWPNTKYYVNDVFSKKYIGVYATFENGKIKDVTQASSLSIYYENDENKINYLDSSFDKIGAVIIEANYGSYVLKNKIEVIQNFLGIGIKQNPKQTTYQGAYTNGSKINVNISGIKVFLYWGPLSNYDKNTKYQKEIYLKDSNDINSDGYEYSPTEVTFVSDYGNQQQKEITITYEDFSTSFLINLVQQTKKWQWTQLYEYPGDQKVGYISKDAYIPIKNGALCPITAEQWNDFLKKLEDLEILGTFEFTKVNPGDDFWKAFKTLNDLMIKQKVENWPDFGYSAYGQYFLNAQIFIDLENFVNLKLQ